MSIKKKMTEHAKEEKSLMSQYKHQEPESDIAELLGLLVKEFKTTVINMLRSLIDK